MKYPTFLQIYRKRAKITQRELASSIGGVTQGQISNWETGSSAPTQEQKKKISRILRVHLGKLFPSKGVGT